MADTEVLQFGTHNITVFLEWTQEDGVSYNVSSLPQVALKFTRNTSVQLTVSYNIQYNVNIVAFESFCGQKSATTAVELKFG